MELKDKAHLIANRLGIPYAWEDIMFRLERKVKMPMPIYCGMPVDRTYRAGTPMQDHCLNKGRWIITCNVQSNIGCYPYSRIVCTRHKDEHISDLEKMTNVSNTSDNLELLTQNENY